jgi:anti-sigma B factor antagonist
VNTLVSVDTSGPVPVARISGEIDLANGPRLRDELLALAVVDFAGLVVDLTGVTYLDSSGVKVLFQLARDLRQHDQTLLVTVPIGSPLRRVLKITGLHEVAPMCDDLDAAFNLVAQTPGERT